MNNYGIKAGRQPQGRDELVRTFIRDFSTLTQLAGRWQDPAEGRTLRPVVTKHLGTDPSSVPMVTESFGPHQLADANNIINELLSHASDVQLIGVAGQARHHADLQELVGVGYDQGVIGEPGYMTLPIGPSEYRRFVSLGLYLSFLQNHPMVLLLRQANPQYG